VTTAPPVQPGASARLAHSFDGEALAAELTAVREQPWARQRVYGEDVGWASKADWTCLALRSPGGDGTRTDPGGPGPVEFADTPWLDRTPLARAVLDSIPAPLRAVRYMALGPGAVSHLHFDTKYGPRYGVARLHVPVVTNPGATLQLDGEKHNWQPGELWFGDFSRDHLVSNTGDEPRVHMVIDCLMVPGLADVFPEEWHDFLLGEPGDWECSFDVPETFTDWEEEDGAFLDPAVPRRPARVRAEEDALLLEYEGARPIRLVHIADGEFRNAGWSQERTVQLLPERREVVLRSRLGSAVRTLTLAMNHD
jgi:quercetin dioxygenase-like cupin family protein